MGNGALVTVARSRGLHPVVKQKDEQLIERSYAASVPIIITKGFRSIEYQISSTHSAALSIRGLS